MTLTPNQVVCGIFVCLALTLFLALAAAAFWFRHRQCERCAKDFRLSAIDSLKDTLAGSELFAWCPDCQREFATFREKTEPTQQKAAVISSGKSKS